MEDRTSYSARLWREAYEEGCSYVVHLDSAGEFRVFELCLNPWNGDYFSYQCTFERFEDLRDWSAASPDVRIKMVRFM